MNDAIIRFENVSKWYGEVLGIGGVSLGIGRGITGLLGPNGAGKSTMLKLMAGQLRPSHGRVTTFGRRIWNNPRMMRRIGFCPEQDSFYEDMTGREFVTYLARLSGFSRDDAEETARRLLARVGLSYAQDRALGKYSKGMRQRTKLAQSLIHDPELLILDEPLSGADPIARRDVMAMIRSFEAEGRTVLVSSHVLHEVEALTTNVVLVDQGKIIAEGDFREIRDLINTQPHHVYIRVDRPRDLAQRLLEMESVTTVEFHASGDALTALTEDANLFFRALPRLVLELDLDVKHVECPDDNLSAVFQYLVRG